MGDTSVDVDSEAILCPLNKPPHHSAVMTILLVGANGVGKHELAWSMVEICKHSDRTRAMVGVRIPFSLQVRTATALPLPSNINGERPRIDFVVFVINLSNRKSFTAVHKALAGLDASYYLGRSCFVVTGTDNPTAASMEVEVITKLAESYNSPLLFGSMKDSDSKMGLASRIIEMAQPSASLHTNLTPLLFDLPKPVTHYTDGMYFS